MSRKNFGPSVKNGEILYTSPSQITTADHDSYGGCLMKWYREKILKIRFPQSKGQREGDQAHKRIAHFILTGENVLTRNERILKPYFPIDGDKFKIETEISEDYPLDLDGVPLIGYIDFLNLSGFYSTPTGRRVQDSCGASDRDWETRF